MWIDWRLNDRIEDIMRFVHDIGVTRWSDLQFEIVKYTQIKKTSLPRQKFTNINQKENTEEPKDASIQNQNRYATFTSGKGSSKTFAYQKCDIFLDESERCVVVQDSLKKSEFFKLKYARAFFGEDMRAKFIPNPSKKSLSTINGKSVEKGFLTCIYLSKNKVLKVLVLRLKNVDFAMELQEIINSSQWRLKNSERFCSKGLFASEFLDIKRI